VSRDEILYHAKIHPEQYTHSLNDAQLSQLFESLLGVCSVAVETLAEQEKFPEEWLMKHRWSKGKKDKSKLPNGQKIEFVKVGGRTSAFVPSVQKITGSNVDGVTGNTKKAIETNEDDDPNNQHAKNDPKPSKKRAAAPKVNSKEPKKIASGKGKTMNEDDHDTDNVEDDDEEASIEEEPIPKKRRVLTIDKLWGKKTDKKPSSSKRATK
jgi:formamidopyrimidine-DNA glycosylase